MRTTGCTTARYKRTTDGYKSWHRSSVGMRMKAKAAVGKGSEEKG